MTSDLEVLFMHLYQKQHILGAVFLGAVAIASFTNVKPAQSFTWTSDSASFGAGDLAGTDFDVFFYDGYIDGVLTPGLTSKATFSLLEDFDLSDNKQSFGVTITNTSDPSIFNRVRLSGLGFNTNPELTGASIKTQGTGFDIKAVLDSKVPQKPITGGKLDVCFTAGVSCTGGGGNGIELGSSYSFETLLSFVNPPTNFLTFDNFVTRYQSIDFKNGAQGQSGVGVGTVPTPAMLPGLIGMGIAAWRKKKKQDSEEKADSSLV
ncbi:cistern family PEP-CTERM protein [Altericista sp. CCNU0014]|uniref:cistern family PEP-CTERM protein n=1 Tax=Altericista sp. CCNU0014 TaxID=3082949 RepID=UPI00384C8D46